MRKYEPIWIKLKAEGTASLAAQPSLHARIIKAVRKEKDEDIGWKLLNLEQDAKYTLFEKIEGKLVTFYLEKKIVYTVTSL